MAGSGEESEGELEALVSDEAGESEESDDDDSVEAPPPANFGKRRMPVKPIRPTDPFQLTLQYGQLVKLFEEMTKVDSKGVAKADDKQSEHWHYMKAQTVKLKKELDAAGVQQKAYKKDMDVWEKYQRRTMKQLTKEQKGEGKPRKKRKKRDADAPPRVVNGWEKCHQHPLDGTAFDRSRQLDQTLMWGGLRAAKSESTPTYLGNGERRRVGVVKSGDCYTIIDEWGNQARLKPHLKTNEDKCWLELKAGCQMPDIASARNAYQVANVQGRNVPNPHPYPGGPYVQARSQ